jgi:DNA-binding MarR family transcriptional regulator/ribosomal protein S18 acetylase RimI-like enzyme
MMHVSRWLLAKEGRAVVDADQVGAVRESARRVVRELGFLDQTLAATPYAPSTVHALIEIDRAPGITAAELAEVLLLDRSTVSRLLRKLADAGEVRDDLPAADRRQKALGLTDTGQRTVAAIHDYGAAQVKDAFAYLSEGARDTVQDGLGLYADALASKREQRPIPGRGSGITIEEQLRPGDIGQVVALHAREYQQISGFGVEFEALVARDLADFVALDHPDSRIWIARAPHGTVLGSIAIDLSGGLDDAHLRWFLLSSEARGTGLGGRLLNTAVAYADSRGVRTTVLWTFQGLDTARAMYEKHGFVLTLEQPGNRWGSTVVEQQFRRATPRSDQIAEPPAGG